MDADLQNLSLQLAQVAVKNSVASVADRIRAVKARRRDQETIAALEEIINDLQSDKSELVRIAQEYDQELVAQKISQADIEYITTSFVPLLHQLIETMPATEMASARQAIDLIGPILSMEAVTVLQLIGFNFRRAIGEPFTQLVNQWILSKAPANPALPLEIQRLTLAVAQDSEAYSRLLRMVGGQQTDVANATETG